MQLQLSSDKFIMNLPGSDTLAMAQQESQNSSPDSELDSSTIVNGSNSDNESTSGGSFNQFELETSSNHTQNLDSHGV